MATAPLVQELIENAKIKVGLSWPNLKKASESDTEGEKWGVLFLGTQKEISKCKSPVSFLSKKGIPLPEKPKLDGIIALDGSWREAKALWWRNAWLTKLTRIMLNPPSPSVYGKKRAEPRREALSTLEAIGLVLADIHSNPKIFEFLSEEMRKRLAL